MATHGPSLFDRLAAQAARAREILAPATADQDPAAIAARHAAQDKAEASIDLRDRQHLERWSIALARHLPPAVRAVAMARLRPLAIAAIRLHAVHQRQPRQPFPTHSKPSMTDDLISYLTRTRPNDGHVAEASPRRPSAITQLLAWRSDPAAFHEFLLANADIAPCADPMVDLARRVSAHRVRLLAANGRAVKQHARQRARWRSAERAVERINRGLELTEVSRPVAKTAKGQRQPPDLARYHAVARSRALVREFRCWQKAYRLRDAHQFTIEPLTVTFSASKGNAVIIGSAGVDLTSPDTIRRSLSDLGAWSSHQGRKPFVHHLEHLIVTLAPGHSDRADLPEQLLYHAHRDAARLGVDLRHHPHIIVQHVGETAHPHCHVYFSRIRMTDSAVLQIPHEHGWRALAIDRDVCDRSFQRSHGLDDESLFAPISGWNGVSRAATAALEKGSAQGSIVHMDGERESYEIYGQQAANRLMRWVGFQSPEQMVPGGLAKLVSQHSDLGAPVRAGADMVDYLLRL